MMSKKVFGLILAAAITAAVAGFLVKRVKKK